ncbi:hypothetical protein CEXT_786141 [Caerostris extrusa]|uniref:Uncharacterized protein n=1 Tax=Caerostris extrusa TaxID=172846 RepID=A0AAV4V095_CAEEX|nr:hypothetical protein CEXT_786141 [Caerostris extrusa]
MKKITEAYSHDSNSYTVISPKPSKIAPQTNVVNTPNPNKDFKLSAGLNDGQTSFRRPGCFQAVPMSIPSVHSAARRLEPVSSDRNENSEVKKNEVYSNNTSEQSVEISIQLKPCNARRSPSNFDHPVEDKINQRNENQLNTTSEEPPKVPPHAVPLKASSVSNKPGSNEPPTIPPKRSSLGLNIGITDLPPKTVKHENNLERNISGKQLEKNKIIERK